MLNGKNILITGGTGSFGQAFCRYVLKNFRPQRLIVYSRDEFKQSVMQEDPIFRDRCMRYFLGDIRDLQRLTKAMSGVDYVVHAAALKQVPAAEYNPNEFIHTNIQGTVNVCEAALANQVECAVALSTDKAVTPINLYGATKLCAEKAFIASNSYSGKNRTTRGGQGYHYGCSYDAVFHHIGARGKVCFAVVISNAGWRDFHSDASELYDNRFSERCCPEVFAEDYRVKAWRKTP